MRGFLAALVIFAGGFAIGFFLRDLLPTARSGADRRPDTRATGSDAVAVTVGRAERSAEREGPRDGGDRHRERRDDDQPREERSRAEAFADFKDALARGDRGAAHEALDDLARGGGEPLPPEALAELGSLLGAVDPHFVEMLSRALVVAGGAEGVAMVMAFAADSGQTVEARRRALHGLSNVPPEHASTVTPALADFLESGPPRELQHAAAEAIGRVHRDQAAGALLGLLEEWPGIPADVVFDAIGHTGRPEDAGALLGLLAGDRSRDEKIGLLRAIGNLSGRGGDSSLLLDLLGETPEGVSREMVAHAIADSSHQLDAAFMKDALWEASGDRRAQEWIARALARSGGKAGLEALLSAAADPEIGLDSRTLARALGEFHGADAVPVMADLLRRSLEEETVEPLARGMARNGSREAVDELLSVLAESTDAWQRRAIARSLEEADGSMLPADRLLELLRGETDRHVGADLARALGRLHPEEVRERALELFDAASSPVERIAFAHALERQETPGAADAIARALRSETDGDARWELARVLGRLGDEGVARVAGLLRDEPDSERRHSMLWGLEAASRGGASTSREVFLEMAAGDPSPDIRAQAAEILGRQRDASVVPALERLLAAESNPGVRERIVRALESLRR